MKSRHPSVCALALALCCAASATAAGRPTTAVPLAAGKSAIGSGSQDDGWVRIAVVAASAKGLEGDRPLRYAYRDGERLETMLGSVGQIEPANLFLLKAESKEEFRKSLARIGGRIGELKSGNRKVFLQFYYSGHGGAKKFHFADGTITFDDVKAALGGDRADARVYVLDVCFGASFFNAKGFRTAPPVQLQMEMDQAARGEVTISSSSLDEQAYEVKTLGGSIFTSHWIMALRGAGDRNRDGQVTLFEAYNYAYDRTSGYSAETLDRPQHPSFQMDLTGARDVTLARLLRSSTGILFKGCPAGLYNVVDLQRGIQIGELRIPQGEEFTLALEPGRYRVQYQPGKGASQAADLELADASMSTLPFAAFQAQTAQLGQAKGEDDTEPARADRERFKAERVGFWGRMGWSAWGGAAGFEDADLDGNLRAVPEVDRYFGTAGRFDKPDLKSDWGFDVTWALGRDWTVGARIGFSSAGYAMDAMGREPLHSLPDSTRDRYPVRLSWDYDYTDFRFGAIASRHMQVTRLQTLTAEAGVSTVTRSLTGERVVDRPLYQTVTRNTVELNGDGVRLEAGLGYRMVLPGRFIGKGLALGLRLSPYYQKVDGLWEVEGRNLSANEFGFAAALTFNLLGRNAGAPRAISGRSP